MAGYLSTRFAGPQVHDNATTSNKQRYGRLTGTILDCTIASIMEPVFFSVRQGRVQVLSCKNASQHEETIVAYDAVFGLIAAFEFWCRRKWEVEVGGYELTHFIG